MGRLKSDFKDLPTAQMRCKIFARIVRMALCHKDDPSKSCANLMDGVIKAELKEFANKLQGTYSDVPKKYLAVMGKGEGSFVSSGRWKNWWDGARPNPKKLEVTSYLLPQTNFWLNPNETIATSFSSFDYKDTLRFKKSEGALHPIYTFLKAVDLWAGEKSCTLEAIKLLLEIQDTWRPKRVVSLSQNSMQKYEWFVSPLSNAEIPSELITDTFCFFEPSSILQTMLWTGDFLGISKTEIYTRWTFDLLSAALATKALIYSKDRESAEVGQTASDLGGKSLDVMSFL